MVTPDKSIDVQHADCDVSSGRIFVEGEVPAGKAACLMPRRYRKQPDWWVIEVAAIDAPTRQAQSFRLSCETEGLWGTEGIEVVGPSSSTRIPKMPDERPRKKLGSGTRIIRSTGDATADSD